LTTKNYCNIGKSRFPTKYVYAIGTKISGSGSTIKKILAPALAIQNRLGFGSTALVKTVPYQLP